jgi:hypothetical protein
MPQQCCLVVYYNDDGNAVVNAVVNMGVAVKQNLECFSFSFTSNDYSHHDYTLPFRLQMSKNFSQFFITHTSRTNRESLFFRFGLQPRLPRFLPNSRKFRPQCIVTKFVARDQDNLKSCTDLHVRSRTRLHVAMEILYRTSRL